MRGDRILLHVVGRQPVVRRADEGLEEGPGPARQPAQEQRLRGRRGPLALRCSGRLDPPDERRRRAATAASTGAAARRAHPGLSKRQADTAAERQRRRDPHRAQRLAGLSAARAVRCATSAEGRHSSSRRRDTSTRQQRAHDRVEAEQPLRSGRQARSAQPAQRTAARLARRWPPGAGLRAGGRGLAGTRSGSRRGERPARSSGRAARVHSAGRAAASIRAAAAASTPPAPGCAAGCRRSSSATAPTAGCAGRSRLRGTRRKPASARSASRRGSSGGAG